MGYDIKALLEYEKKFATTRKALDYLWIANWCHNGDKAKILETCKANLAVLKTEFEIASMIEAIKIVKRGRTTKLGINN